MTKYLYQSSVAFFWVKPFIQFWEIVCCSLYGKFPLGMLADMACGDAWSIDICKDLWLASYICNAHPRLHEVWLQGFVVLYYLGFISKHSITWNHKGREMMVHAGPGRLRGISSYFRAHGKEGPASGFRWLLDGPARFVLRPSRMQAVWCFQIFLISRSPRSSVGADIPSVSSTSALRPVYLWFVTDYSLWRWCWSPN